MVERYSKTYKGMYEFKQDLLEDNDNRVVQKAKVRQIYKSQPYREGCKLCGKMEKKWSFVAHDIEYFICNECGHLNGAYRDTEEYCQLLYERGGKYGDDYKSETIEEFDKRVNVIYKPKVDFLCEVIGNEAESQNKHVLDVGAGTGYFVKALRDAGFDAVGIDVDDKQILESYQYLSSSNMKHIKSEEVCKYIRGAEAEIVTFIYSLEHVVNLNEILDSVQENPSIKYVYFSVPMFCYSVAMSSIFDDVLDRVLVGGEHSHLFTEESIDWLCEKYNWEKLGAWYFGADVADLIRTFQVRLRKAGNDDLADFFGKKMVENMDGLQEVLDKSKFSSDIHIVLKKQNNNGDL